MRSLILFLVVLVVACATARQPSFNPPLPSGSYRSGEIVRFSDRGLVLNDYDNVEALAFSPDLRYVAATRASEKYYAWSVYSADTGQLSTDQDFVDTYYDPEGVAFYGGGDRLLTLDDRGRVSLWDVKTRQIIAGIDLPGGSADRLKEEAAKDPLGISLAKVDDHDKVPREGQDFRSMSVDAPRNLVAVCGDNGSAVLLRYDQKEAAFREQFSWQAHNGPCTAIRFLSGGERIVTGGWDGVISVWEIARLAIRTASEPLILTEDRSPLRKLFESGFCINDLSVSADGRFVAAAVSVDVAELDAKISKRIEAGDPGPVVTGNGVLVYDLDGAEQKPILNWSGAAGPVTAVAISPDGRYVAAGGWDFTVRLVDVRAGLVVDQLRYGRHIQQIRFSADGQVLAVANWVRTELMQMSRRPSLTLHPLTYKDSEVVRPAPRSLGEVGSFSEVGKK